MARSDEERLRRIDIMIDLYFSARLLGFSGVHVGVWGWSMRAPMEDLHRHHELQRRRVEIWRGKNITGWGNKMT